MLIDKYSIGFGLIIVALSMCLGIVFCYGEWSGRPRGCSQRWGVRWGAASMGLWCCRPWALLQAVYSTGQPLATTLPRLGWHSWGSWQTMARLCRVHLQLWAAWRPAGWAGRYPHPAAQPCKETVHSRGAIFPVFGGCHFLSIHRSVVDVQHPGTGLSWVPRCGCTRQGRSGGGQGPSSDPLPGGLQA